MKIRTAPSLLVAAALCAACSSEVDAPRAAVSVAEVDHCMGVGTWYPDSRKCEIREGERRWQAVTPTFAKMIDGLGGCPTGYGPEPNFPGYCGAGYPPSSSTDARTVRLNPEQAAEFNRRQQAKRDMQDAVQAAIRAEREAR